MRFHLAQMVLGRRLHWLQGNAPAVDATAAALAGMGHAVSRGQNQINADATNIVFGGLMVGAGQRRQLPRSTIFFNTQKLGGLSPAELRLRFGDIAETFRIWDTLAANIPVWRAMGTAHPPRLVPMGYAAVLERAPAAGEQDIDVLFAGGPTPTAISLFHEVAKTLLRAVFASGVYGSALDGLLWRSRLVVGFPSAPPQLDDAVPLALALANRRAVLATPEFGAGLNERWRGTLIERPAEVLHHVAVELVRDEARRNAAAAAAYERFRGEDMRASLAAALGG